MKITLNGETKEIAPNTTIISLIEELELSEKRFAVEINHEIIPRSRHDETVLNDADTVEIVVAIGGG